MEATTDEKLGKLWAAITEIRGDIKNLYQTVFGNGVKGHEHRLEDLENIANHRRETCPLLKDLGDKKTQAQIVLGLWLNGLMMAAGFLALFLKG